MVSSTSCYVTGKTPWGKAVWPTVLSCHITGKTRWGKAGWSAVPVVTSLVRPDGGGEGGGEGGQGAMPASPAPQVDSSLPGRLAGVSWWRTGCW